MVIVDATQGCYTQNTGIVRVIHLHTLVLHLQPPKRATHRQQSLSMTTQCGIQLITQL